MSFFTYKQSVCDCVCVPHGYSSLWCVSLSSFVFLSPFFFLWVQMFSLVPVSAVSVRTCMWWWSGSWGVSQHSCVPSTYHEALCLLQLFLNSSQAYCFQRSGNTQDASWNSRGFCVQPVGNTYQLFFVFCVSHRSVATVILSCLPYLSAPCLFISTACQYSL